MERPVFDVATELALPLDSSSGDWIAGRACRAGHTVFRAGRDGPDVRWRQAAQAARITSNRFRGQHDNDNIDWPLGKLLRAERADYHLRLAERYRDLWTAATEPTELRGKDLSASVYLAADLRLDESTGRLIDKGRKAVTGKRAQVDGAPRRAAAIDPDQAKARAKPIPKAWTGDWPLLHAIDARRELAGAQAALGWLREAFEAAVCRGETLEAIGREHGVGNKTGAKGAGRALVMLGLQAVDELWRKPRSQTSPHVPATQAPAGYYKSTMCPGLAFKRHG